MEDSFVKLNPSHNVCRMRLMGNKDTDTDFMLQLERYYSCQSLQILQENYDATSAAEYI